VQLLEDSLRYGKYEEAADIVPALQAGVQESYDDVRELLLNFRSRLAEDDLIGALKRTIEKFRRQTDIETRLVIDGDGPPFPREEQLQVLFIVQEALSNIRKHAEAHTVEIHIENRQDFMLNIRDNGVGFDSRTLLEKKDSHVGLKIMRERAHRIHASLAVTSEPGKGTTVSLQLPREHRHAA
jgi:two-component system, NarL family, nitrate/nitrite sensor histidine kinase NarX